MNIDAHKGSILAALEEGRAKGARIRDAKGRRIVPDDLSTDKVWNAISGVVRQTSSVFGRKRSSHGLRGRPSGGATEYLVAYLAPIYRRYTGAEVGTTGRRSVKKRPALISFAGDDRRPPKSRKIGPLVDGPFAHFVCTVAKACDLPVGVTSIPKVIATLRVLGD